MVTKRPDDAGEPHDPSKLSAETERFLHTIGQALPAPPAPLQPPTGPPSGPKPPTPLAGDAPILIPMDLLQAHRRVAGLVAYFYIALVNCGVPPETALALTFSYQATMLAATNNAYAAQAAPDDTTPGK